MTAGLPLIKNTTANDFPRHSSAERLLPIDAMFLDLTA
jgi:hypothetical protein